MTGFARVTGNFDTFNWVWEMRAVNGKGLDLRLRLPNGFDRLEAPLRKIASKSLSRGNVQISLNLNWENQQTVPVVNQAALDQVTRSIEKIDAEINTTPSSAAQILALRGVMELSEPEIPDDILAGLDIQISQSFEKAVTELLSARKREGDALLAILSGHLGKVSGLTLKVESDPSRSPPAIRARLEAQLEKYDLSALDLDKDRMHQEAVILAAKADLREELDRLLAHVDAGHQLLKDKLPVGRKLEFLAQEFNREANTLCSKSNAVSVTELGLELKLVIDQFREQVLNVE